MKTNKIAIAAVSLLLASASVLTAAGISQAATIQSHPSQAFAERIETLLELPGLSEREVSVLSEAAKTGEISIEAYEATHAEYARCVSDLGFKPEFRKADKGFYVELPYRDVVDPEGLDKAVISCSQDSDAIYSLFTTQQMNPTMEVDARIVAIQCLSEIGSVPEGYSPDQFWSDYKAMEFPFPQYEARNNDCMYGAGFAAFDLG
ncbi:hypothetical protein GCM10009860_14650 [Microbacterium mitrae]|uniref:DUF732 domain-containing protein n=2 Tax=Microbacterium mitrae TaxID=664640 RepID=A0A5C8HMH8_9MICO|nr:hypothetical protein FVP60_11205 [Microbacterium mitrae]